MTGSVELRFTNLFHTTHRFSVFHNAHIRHSCAFIIKVETGGARELTGNQWMGVTTKQLFWISRPPDRSLPKTYADSINTWFVDKYHSELTPNKYTLLVSM